MKVLAVNKFHYIKGGSETYYFSLKELLEKNGNEVVDFSMKDKNNFASPYQDYFVDNVDYDSRPGLFGKMKLASNIIYSFEAKNKIQSLIRKEKPDIAHLHIFQHQLSPSILRPLKENGIPIVYTAHDLKAACPNYKMLSHGQVCEECKGGKFYSCLKNRCVKDSYSKSLVNTVEMYFHALTGSYALIDIIVTPSDFYRRKLIEFGFDREKIVHIPNFLDATKFNPSYSYENYFVYLGRLSEEKGVFTLLKAMNLVDGAALYIVGGGPLEGEVVNYIKEYGLSGKVRLLGFKTGKELEDLVSKSMFSIIPSEWYENGPYSLLEMMAYGKPVIGSRIGGIPEFIEDNKTGLIFEPGNVNDLAGKISKLLNNDALINEFGKNARRMLEENFNKDLHYEKIFRIYSDLQRKAA